MMFLGFLGWMMLGLVEPPLVDVPIETLKVVMSPAWIPNGPIHPAALETLGFPRAGAFPTQELPDAAGLRIRGTLEARVGTRGFRMRLRPGERITGRVSGGAHPRLNLILRFGATPEGARQLPEGAWTCQAPSDRGMEIFWIVTGTPSEPFELELRREGGPEAPGPAGVVSAAPRR